MINQPNTLVTTEWVLPYFTEQLNDLHARLKQESMSDELKQVAQGYHQVYGAMLVANLSPFAHLASAIESVLDAVYAEYLPEIYAHKALYASELLLHELRNFVQTGLCNEQLLSNRCHYLHQTLTAHGAGDFIASNKITSQQATTQDNASTVSTSMNLELSGADLSHSQTDRSMGEEGKSQVQEARFRVEQTHLLALAKLSDYLSELTDDEQLEHHVLTHPQKQVLLKVWRVGIQSLLLVNQNDERSLHRLTQVVSYLRQDAMTRQVMALANLWHLCELWVSSLVLNVIPKPNVYAHLLAQLDALIIQVLQNQTVQNNEIQPLLIDVYLQLTHLEMMTQPATQVMQGIKQELEQDRDFFPRVMSELEQLIFKLSDDTQPLIESVKHIQSQLQGRGWTRFDEPLNQVLSDLAYGSESADTFAQMQWQIERQLQEIYGAIFATHQTIESQIGHSKNSYVKSISDAGVNEQLAGQVDEAFEANQTLREARIAIEELKNGFNEFLREHDSQILDRPEDFELLVSMFTDMGLSDMVDVVSRAGTIFSQIVAQNMTHITWSLTDAIAQMLATLELFMDYLAQQSLNEPLLEKLKESLIEAEHHLVALLENPDLLNHALADIKQMQKPSHFTETRYDDAGEIEPTQTSLDTNLDLKQPDEVTQTQEVAPESAELQEARAELKEDDFSIDEDIREIFIEEAEEVQAVLDEYLPRWREEPNDLEPLTEIRRGFHTLKGSGRMVGAFNAGEMAWAVENLLNRVLDGTLAVSDELVDFIIATKDIIPTLVQDFANKQPPSIDPAVTVLQAHNLQKGRALDFGLAKAQPLAPATTPAPVTDIDTDTDTEVGDAQLQEDLVEAPADGSIAPAIAPAQKRSVEQAMLPEGLQPYFAQVDVPADSGDGDADIKEIFIEEAGEVLEAITPQVAEWRVYPNELELLNDIRRGFHTLKGSGRMVGANTSAELAWAVENMLNRVLDNTIEPVAGLQVLVGDVVEAYPDLVATFEAGTANYPAMLPVWIACATAYSKNAGETFDYVQVKKEVMTGASATVGKKKAHKESPQLISDDPHSQATLAETQIQQTEETPEISKVSEQVAGSDDVQQIFLQEAFDIVEQIQSFLAQHGDDDTADVTDELVRAFHTLRGAAATQDLAVINELSASVEQSLEQLQHHDEVMHNSHLQAITQSADFITHYLQAFETEVDSQDSQDKATSDQEIAYNQTNLDGIYELLEASSTPAQCESYSIAYLIGDDIDDFLDGEWELEKQLTQTDLSQVSLYAEVMSAQAGLLLERVNQQQSKQSEKFVRIVSALQAVYDLLIKQPQISQKDDVLSALANGHEQLTVLLDALAGGMTLQLDESALSALHAIAKPKSDPKKYATTEGMVTSEPLQLETIETDPELLEIFLEEAQEVDADIVSSFSAWATQPDDLNTLKILQRHLHTIKGGARMAGISSIGDLTHEAETIYEFFVDNKIEPTPDWVSFMQSVQDLLSAQIDYVITQGQSFFAHDAVEQLKQLAKTRQLPEGIQLKVPQWHAVDTDADEKTEAEASDTQDALELEAASEAEAQYQHLVQTSWADAPPDADILEVFLEEADELVESGSTHLQTFRNNTSDIVSLQELQRDLHTMKGGARMVGAGGLADLAHHMETVYEDLASRRRPATKMVGQLLAQCHDWMADAVIILEHGINPPRPNELITQLQNFTKSPDALQTLSQENLQSYLDIIADYEAKKDERLGRHDISQMPPTMLNQQTSEDTPSLSGEMIRVSSNLMEQMINLSGESAINRARIDMSMTSLNQTIDEMGMTVQRLADQLRRMDGELEAQILSQIDDETLLDAEFDPLEMDQYSSLNQLSKSLSESASDLLDIKTTMLDKTRDAENLLLQLSRTQAELQDGLMDSRMVPFSRLTPRLQRIVRQTANELGKSVELVITNADDEMDRTILERITSPLEHMLRNAVDHGVESPEEREALGKPRTGRIVLSVTREGSEVVIRLSDDGSGINVDAVRAKAIKQGLIDADDTSLSDLDVMQYIFNAGLTTTSKVTQISGRGVGMDVVLSEVRQLGGTVSVDSSPNQGSVFSIRVPLTVAISDALVVRVADRYYAIPLVQIERVERVNPEKLMAFYQSDNPMFDINGKPYRLRYLNEMLTGASLNQLAVNTNASLPVIIVKNQTGQNLAVQVDEVAGSRIEVVVKPLGRQLSHIAGISSATIMGDGSVMLILDVLALIRNAPARAAIQKQAIQDSSATKSRTSVMIVDDSVTVRKVTSRLLERYGFDTQTARDGADALEILQDYKPDVMLLDIEMPRMDGFEVASHIRHDSRLKELPIIMITSRTGDKHRERAMEIGVNDYMGKPFQEAQLISTIQSLTGVDVGDNSNG